MKYHSFAATAALLLFHCTATLTPGAEFFLSLNGDDTHPGSPAQPWKTLDKANRTLRLGDAVTLRDGTFPGLISPAASGESNSRAIIYRSEKRHGAVLVGQSGANTIVTLKGKRFVVVDGFKLLPARGGFGRVDECHHVTIANCHMEHSTQAYTGLEFIDSHDNRVLDNNLTRVIYRTTDSKINGDGLGFKDCFNNVIEGNSFSKFGHTAMRITSTRPPAPKNYIIRGNLFHNGRGRNFALHNIDRCLFEANVVSDSFNGALSADSLAKVFLTDGIFRNNLICDNGDAVLSSKSYQEGVLLLSLNNSRIYHNTFANNPAHVWELPSQIGGAEPIRANSFFNNLFFRNDNAGGFDALVLSSPGCAADNLFQHNLLFGEKSGQAGVRINKTRYTAKAMNRELPARARNNLDADPRFVSFQDRCFALTADSPARNAGQPLTRSVGAGAGQELRVADARCFFDGFGIEGEQGDVIVVGPAKEFARVLKADIAKNVLTLDRELRWRDGDPVSLPYAGSAPDIGAFPQGDTGVLAVVPRAQPARVVPGQPVAFSALVSGAKGAVKLNWDFGDETITEETAPKHAYRETNDYTVRVRGSDAAGTVTRGLMLVRVERAVDLQTPLLQLGFEEADFEEWGHPWDEGPVRGVDKYFPEAREDDRGQAMGMLSSVGENPFNDRRGISAEKIARFMQQDSHLASGVKLREWDIDKYPWISFAYRIPKGVPVGVWLLPWPADGRPSRICLGGSPANSAGNLPNVAACKLVDDGQWHTAEVDARAVRQVMPETKLLLAFEFYTDAQTTAGQKLWFDDFMIAPAPNSKSDDRSRVVPPSSPRLPE